MAVLLDKDDAIAEEAVVVKSPPRRKDARRTRPAVEARLRRLGVPQQILSESKAKDLVKLAADLDRFAAFGYDTTTQRRFLREPHPALRGSTPIEVMRLPGGVRVVHDALRKTLSALV